MPTISELDLLQSPLDPGLTVIEASAGTGKTYSISHLVPRLLLEGTLPDLSKLLLVTFTKDAARELAERARRVLGDLAAPPTAGEAQKNPHLAALRSLLNRPGARARLDRALLDLDLLAVSTIHAFCQRTLQQAGSLCGMPVMPEVTTDDSELLLPLVRERWIATLSVDARLAALATASGWQLDDAVRFINTFRRCQRPTSEPAVAPFPELRGQVEELCTRLSSPDLVDGAFELLRQVTGWNKGVESSADALSRLGPLREGSGHTVAYWESLAFAGALPGRITARAAAAKVLKARVEQHPWFVAVRDLVALSSRLQWAWQHQLSGEVLPRLEEALLQRRLITQDGLIGALYRALHRQGVAGEEQSRRLAAHLAERYHVALIDESQDTDPRQFAIFKRVFLDGAAPRRLILVGDPKQAIYGFRGADLSTYLAARTEARSVYTLSHTYRAPEPLVGALNEIFQRNGAFHHPGMMFKPGVSALPFDRQLLHSDIPCSRLEAWIVPDALSGTYSTQGRRATAVSAQIASAIVDLLQHGKLRTRYRDGRPEETVRVTPGDFAVLVATNAQAEAMAEALEARAVPAVVNSGADVFASEEARELHTLLKALLNPRRTRHLRSALATRLLGLDAAALAALDAPASTQGQPTEDWQQRFLSWSQAWAGRGLASLLAELDGPDVAVTRRLALLPLTGERRATNYRHLTDLLLEAAREQAPRPAETVRWLGQQIARTVVRSQVEERQLQLSTDRQAVQVVTMHKAKGMEYPLVFCPYLAESLKDVNGFAQLPTAVPGGKPDADLLLNIDLLDGDAKKQRTRECLAAQLEERLRLAYVALTRAQVRAWFFSYGSSPRFDRGSSLDWLLRTDGEIAAHPAYSDDWVDSAKTGRSTRHTQVLQALGAQPHDAIPSDGQTPSITFRDPPPATGERYLPESHGREGAVTPSALAAPSVPPSWRVTSFSTLTKEKHAHGTPLASPDEPEPPGADMPGEAGPSLPAFFSAPGGTAVGTAVHDWIQTWDMSPPSSDALSRHLFAARLPAIGDGQANWKNVLEELFTDLREIHLPGCGDTPLHELCPEAHGSEWHFHLPLAGTLTVRTLAVCFADHALPEHRPYAAQLSALSEERFQGLLQGFIDRLVRHGPNWGVIDWKTNRLGLSLQDYDESGLLRCAMEDHYLLQAHLYLVALRRYLRALGPTEPSMLGAWLVFLRAIAPGDTRGVLHVRPPAAMLDALDALFAAPACVLP